MTDPTFIPLSDWGLSERFQTMAREMPALLPGRVLSQEKGVYRVIHEKGLQSAAVSGRFRYETSAPSGYPAVGDFVMLESAGEAGQAVIHAVLPRKSVFVRRAAGTAAGGQVVAANVDLVFVCMSLNNDFNLRRLERYLAAAWESGAVPVILLTKADLCAQVAQREAAVASVAAGVEILSVSALETEGCAAILPYLAPGRTIALIGSSGVGKSTLINRLLGEERIKTNGLRSDDKGRHTTTHRELMRLPQGGMVIDTPGMRELGLWDAAEGLHREFADIEELSRSCRFKNCTHTAEPGCAVRGAIARGALSQERWLSYQKLRGENAYAADSEGYLAEKEAKFKEIAKRNRYDPKR